MRILFLTIFSVCLIKLQAQDPHFSQFFASPLTLNPAFTGKFDGNLRIAGNYRNQWATINNAFKTTSFSLDLPILQNRIDQNDTWGVGAMAYSDQSANSAVKLNYFTLSTAFHKGLDENGAHQLGAAFQGTFSNMLINVSSLKFEDQLTSSGFTGVTSENFGNATLQSKYFDLNAGVLYTGSSSIENNFYVGVSMFHINRPKQNFTESAFFLLNPRTTIHAGGYFPAGDNNILHLSGLHSQQAKQQETLIGGTMQFVVGGGQVKPTSFYAGSWIRFNDAVIPYLGLEYGDFRFGVTYDVTTSSLKGASESRGGLELSLIYIKKPLEGRGLSCPKF